MAKEKGSSLLSSIKNQIKNSGNSKGSIFFVKSGDKARIRFLEDFEQGRKVTFHDSFEKGINIPCLKHFGKKCKHCKDESLRTRDFYAWSVYNYENKKVQLFMYPVNNFSPLPALVQMFEVYGKITDRDFSISREGKGTSTQYAVVPLDKVKFKKKDAKPFSEKKFLDILGEAFDASGKSSNNSSSDSDDEDDNNDEGMEMLEELDKDELIELAKGLDISGKKIKKCKSEDSLIELIQTEADEEEIEETYEELFGDDDEESDEDDEDEDIEDDDEDEDEEDEDNDYDEMSLKELRALAKERDIKVKKSMDKDDLIELLEEDDEDE